MRACFLGQHVCALGFGIAVLQLPPLPKPAVGENIVILKPPAQRKRVRRQGDKKIAALRRVPLRDAS